jgi:hypothetical protein
MLREVERSRTGVLVGLVVDLVQPECLVRRLLARRSNNNNNHKEECPAPRSQELGKTVRNLVIGSKKGNASSLTSGLVNVLVIDRERVIERISTTETGTEGEIGIEKERAGVTEEIETVGTVLGITTGSGVGKGNGTTRAVSMKRMAEDHEREKQSMSVMGRSRGELSQRKVMATTKGVDVQAITIVRRNKEVVTKTVITSTVTVMIEWRKKNTVMMIVSTSVQSVPSRVSIDLIADVISSVAIYNNKIPQTLCVCVMKLV